MISFDEATALLTRSVHPLQTERVPLHEADGRVLVKSVEARLTCPAAMVSAMDGYAVKDEDIANSPAALDVVDTVFAGDPSDRVLQSGTCVRIFTGAAVPDGADRVVPQECATQDGLVARFSATPGQSRHLRAAGSDFRMGDVLIAANTVLTPQCLMAAAAGDVAELDVVRRPRVVIIACGDELVPPAAPTARADQVRDSISFGVGALAHRWGGIVIDRLLRPDDLPLLQRTAADAVAHADVVVVTGGASVGERDYAKAMFAPLGLRFVFNKVAIKPGKPVWFGNVGDTLVLGLPGNPTSAFVTARLFLAPLLAGLAGHNPEAAWAWRTLPAAEDIEVCEGRESFLRATVTPAGLLRLKDQGSAAQKALAEATDLIRRRSGAPHIERGEFVDALAL